MTKVCWNVKEGKANQHKRKRDRLESINDLIYNCQPSCSVTVSIKDGSRQHQENQLYHQILKLQVRAEAYHFPCKSIPTPFLCFGQRIIGVSWNQLMK